MVISGFPYSSTSSGGNDEESKARAGYVTSIGSEGYGGPIEASAFRSK